MKVIIATQAYNSEDYLAETIESVLNQTYTNFTYLLIDSASTDSTPQIMQEYAKKDSRIKYIHFDVNDLGRCEQCAVKEDGDYYMALDSDDLLEPNCLEYLLNVAKKSNADIVASGCIRFDDITKEVLDEVKPNYSLLIKEDKFAELYRFIHQYFRTIWGKLYKLDIVKSVDVDKIVESQFFYGKDTWFAFQALRKAKDVYFYDACLQKYRIRTSSVSYTYRAVQSDADIFLFNDAIDFLSKYGEISRENLFYIYLVYANAIKNTVSNLFNANLTSEEKLREYLRIFARPETHDVFNLKHHEIDSARLILLYVLLSFVSDIKEHFNSILQILNLLSPNCTCVIDETTISLFSRNDTFKDYLYKDNKDELADYILTLIESNNPLIRVYDFSGMLKKLAPEESLVASVNDTGFIKFYSGVYAELWNKQNTQALGKMTEILFSGNDLNCPEDFLNLYVTLAALENHVEAFLFGNIQKAYLFIDEKRFDEARQIVNDLVEMGAGESEDVIELQKLL